MSKTIYSVLVQLVSMSVKTSQLSVTVTIGVPHTFLYISVSHSCKYEQSEYI
jgi:hypothetical protein